MELDAISYELPEGLIAAFPSEEREASRLMVIDRNTGQITHSRFSCLGRFLESGDLLVLNDSRVIPARLNGRKDTGGAAEVLLMEPFGERDHCWIALIDSSKKPGVGTRIIFTPDFSALVVGELGRGRYGLEFFGTNGKPAEVRPVLEEIGEVPLPAYVYRARSKGRASEDGDRYQTVYASSAGSVAAPTAGLHFTDELLANLASQGVAHSFLTLHVGPGTFRPVRAQRVEEHTMEGEWYTLSGETAGRIIRTKERGGRVVAVGSTTTRTLEGSVQKMGRIQADAGITRLFVTEGYSFRIIDALITNFHLPRSTPLLLVGAFAGFDLLRRAYAEAIKLKYRFYSYGDAMLIV